MIIEAYFKLRVRISTMKPPGNTLLDPEWHVEDAGLVSFAQKGSINRLIAELTENT